MGYKLTKDQAKKWDELAKSVEQERELLVDTLASFQAAVRDAWGNLQEYVEDYNGAVTQMKEFMSEVAEDWRAQFDEASEGWQESDKGQEIDGKIEEMEGFEPEEFVLNDIEEQEPPDDITDDLNNLKGE